MTGQRLYLRESTRNERQVPEIRARLVATVDKQRHACATVDLSFLLDEWIDAHELDDNTRDTPAGEPGHGRLARDSMSSPQFA